MCKIYLNEFSLLVVTTALLWPTIFSEPTPPDSLHSSQSKPIEVSTLLDVLNAKSLAKENSDPKTGNYSALNLAHDFDPNFHTAFAMIGFTTILIAISVFGISVSMWNLDPGKDSIIYRMTSQRIKKDQ